jgi:hypothetical protein
MAGFVWANYVLPSYQTEQTPTCALFMSSSVMPVAYSIACEAPCTLDWVKILSRHVTSYQASVRRRALRSSLSRARMGDFSLSQHVP